MNLLGVTTCPCGQEFDRFLPEDFGERPMLWGNLEIMEIGEY